MAGAMTPVVNVLATAKRSQTRATLTTVQRDAGAVRAGRRPGEGLLPQHQAAAPLRPACRVRYHTGE
jgi:hypothetical protein